jgi:rubrerythrin
MRFKQVEDILSWVVQFHADLELHYRELEEGNTNERVVMLLEYLADHQQILGGAIEKFKGDASSQLLNTWFNQTPEVNYPEKLVSLASGVSGASTSEVVLIAIECHDLLIQMYKALQSDSDMQSVKDLFQTLIDMEQHEKLRMVRDAGRLEDL